ncbi:twin-arginine translocase subunit TatB [Rhodopseudomonas boonkerdii]|uniref:Sec-independent protein translocase protein TatB n=1 Tax=Rhodopseudomonas boonkerdii TaxID=475937 RepID=UPI001E538E31|nr:Sec-independent protein translocase protein TatB [Rhodopseudomonas boonkerdii]UGV26850.1 twin-arginine translocase subunit TatB [Rhodopseudomonas boonkerdii]
MFDIGWSELVVIGVVALIAIGPKELPGVLRMVGQWMGKARRMAAEFQGQFNEAMREAEMADVKKAFDEVKDAASDFSKNNIMTSLTKDVSEAMTIDKIDNVTTPPVTPTTPEPPTPETFVEAEAHSAVDEPLAITREVQPTPAEPTASDVPVASGSAKPAEAGNPDILKNAKAL